jgi:hypothetical protein
MLHVKPLTVVEEADEATKKVVGAVEADSIPDARAADSEEAKEEKEEEKEVAFDELGLDEQLKRALRKKGMIMATPIQRETVPLILVRNFWRPFFSPCFVRANLVEILGYTSRIVFVSTVDGVQGAKQTNKENKKE